MPSTSQASTSISTPATATIEVSVTNNSLTVIFVLSIEPAKVNKVKIFSGPCYMIKRVLTFVSGVQESVLVHFISQNKVKILHKVKTCQNFDVKNVKKYMMLYYNKKSW